MRAEDIRYIVVHCAATKPGVDVGRKEIDEWHKARGWSGIGYHRVIRLNGDVEEGRPLDKVGAHTKGHNRVSWGVCMVGGVDANNKPAATFTPEQYLALDRVLIELIGYLDHDPVILGHRDLSPDINGDGIIESWEWVKACPSFGVGDWLRARELGDYALPG